MNEIMELKEMLCAELKKFGAKGDLSAGELEIVDKLAHAVKNLGKIIEMDEEEYSGRMSYERGGQGGGRGGNQGGGSYRGSYARGRGRNARRDSMGRYSREDGYSRDMEDMIDSIRGMMGELPPEIQRDAERFVGKLEQHI